MSGTKQVLAARPPVSVKRPRRPPWHRHLHGSDFTWAIAFVTPYARCSAPSPFNAGRTSSRMGTCPMRCRSRSHNWKDGGPNCRRIRRSSLIVAAPGVSSLSRRSRCCVSSAIGRGSWRTAFLSGRRPGCRLAAIAPRTRSVWRPWQELSLALRRTLSISSASVSPRASMQVPPKRTRQV